MRLHRFYTSTKLISELEYTNAEHLHQWRNVFRYGVGDSVILFGDGFEHTYNIEEINKKSAELKEVSVSKSLDRNTNITLAIAIIKKENFELVLQKCTELGVATFIPLITERSIQKNFSKERLEKILTEATEQSGWGSVPVLGESVHYGELLARENCAVLNMSGEKLLQENLKKLIDGTVLCIGPEGGFTEKEIGEAEEAGIKIISLGDGVLRAETAAIALASIVLL
jgi:16S rRNA (uracil1498-N3)-methyltransferase